MGHVSTRTETDLEDLAFEGGGDAGSNRGERSTAQGEVCDAREHSLAVEAHRCILPGVGSRQAAHGRPDRLVQDLWPLALPRAPRTVVDGGDAVGEEVLP